MEMNLSVLTAEEKKIFMLLQRKGPLTKRSMLLYCKDYKFSTLNQIVTSLRSRNAIVSLGYEDSSGGRRPTLFDVNTHKKYILGIDITRTFCYVVLCDMKMNILEKELIYFPQDKEVWKPENIISELAKLAKSILKKRKLTVSDNLLGAGVSMVGPVNRQTGETGNVVSFFNDGWKNIPLASMISTSLGCDVKIDNGAVVAALVEYLYGDGRNYDQISYFNCGFGLRSGQISSGILIRQANNSEDMFAHTSINMMGEHCTCGRRGCINCYASTFAIASNIKRRIIRGEPTIIDVPPEKINYLVYCDAAKRGDKISIEELTEAGTCLGVGLANYITLFNAEYIVIGGPVAVRSSAFFEAAKKTALSNLYNIDLSRIVIKQGGTFGAATMAVGAAAMYFEAFFNNPILQ